MSRVFALQLPLVLLILLMLGLTACGANTPEPTVVVPTATAMPTTPPEPTATVAITPTVAPETTPVTTTTTSTETAVTEANDMLSVIGRARGLEKFGALLQETGLTAEFQGKGPTTLFVFPDTAWDELPQGVTSNPDLVRQILRDHIANGHFLMNDMITAGKVTSLGDELAVFAGGEGATVGGANVLDADYEATDGVLHLLDTVILPQAVITDVMALYPSVVGEQSYPMQGNIHIGNGQVSPIAYNSIPPTSGPHYPNIVAWQLYTEPFRYEQLVHNLEDGGVIIYYQCASACPELVEELRAIAQPYMDAGRHVVVAPNDPTIALADGAKPHGDMGAPIAVVAWRKILKLTQVDAQKIGQFIEAFEGIDHHVK